MKATPFTRRNLVVALGFAVVLAGSASADLIHRYPLNNDANDVIGTANGTPQGNATFDGSSVVLDGNGSYIDLGSGLVSGLTNVTFESWVNWSGGSDWQRIFDFGNTDANGAGAYNIFATVSYGGSNGRARFGISQADPGYNNEYDVSAPDAFPQGVLTHFAATYDTVNNSIHVFVNGQLVAAGTAPFPLNTVQDVYQYLGRSTYPDPYFVGSIGEFRIYNSVLTDLEVAASAASGPDQPSTDPGALLSLAVNANTNTIVGGQETAVAVATFAKVPAFNLNGVSGVTNPAVSFFTSKSSILQVDALGNVTAVGPGSATITAAYSNLTASVTINVSLAPAVLKNRYSFNEASGSATVADSVGGQTGTVINGVNSVSLGDGQATFPGGTYDISSYIALPGRLISTRTNVTIETWLTWQGNDANSDGATWQRVFDFGNSQKGTNAESPGNGINYLFLAPQGGAGDVRFDSLPTAGGTEAILDGPAPLPVGQQVHVVAIYAPSTKTSALYLNGLQIASGGAAVALSKLNDTNDWLGVSQFNDPPFNGSINELRIYEGVLTPQQVAVNYAAGPDALVGATGALNGLAFAAATNTVYINLPNVPTTLLASFANISNVNVSGLSGVTFTSGNTNVVNVTTNGILSGWMPGTTTVTGTFGGLSATTVVVVAFPPGYAPPALIHRYSFNDPAGSATVSDSVGGADGTLLVNTDQHPAGKPVVLGNGLAVLDGTGGYIGLPNNLVSVLTNVTFELWTTWKGGGDWQHLFEFGTTDAGGAGSYDIFCTPVYGGSGGKFRFGISANDPGYANEYDISETALFPRNKGTHVVCVYDYTDGLSRVYINGAVMASGETPFPLSVLQDGNNNNYLGRSDYNDPPYTGSLDEFRIYNGALSAAQVAASYAAGPDATIGVGPTLTAAIGSGGLVITWPDKATGYTLQSTPVLGAAARWAPVTANVTDANGVFSVTIPLANAVGYFRLSQ